MNRNYKRERNQNIVDMRNSGKTYGEIAVKYGVSRQRVEQIYRRAVNVEQSRAIYNKDLLVSLIYKRGETIRSTAKMLGVSPPTMSRKLDGDSEFKFSEMNALRDFLNMTDLEFAYIFFAKK